MPTLCFRPEPFEAYQEPKEALDELAPQEQGFLDWFSPGDAIATRSTPQKVLVARRGIAAKALPLAQQVAAAANASIPSPKAGISPEKVCWLQNVLNKANTENLAEDGIYGPASRAGIRRFQARYALTADGIVGQRTETALVQAALNQIAQTSLVEINGVMNAQTRQEIQRFQAQRNLVRDGIVGPKTRAAMVLALGGRCKPLPTTTGPKPQRPGQQWQRTPSGQQARPATCDYIALIQELRSNCLPPAYGPLVECGLRFGLSAGDAASIALKTLDYALKVAKIPEVGEIAAIVVGVVGGLIAAGKLGFSGYELGQCLYRVLQQQSGCIDAARAKTGCN